MPLRPQRRTAPFLLVALLLALPLWGCTPEQDGSQVPDATDSAEVLIESPGVEDTEVPFVESPQPVVNKMLELANVSEDDVVYDLGSGDGRIPITAARKYGARGVGIEIKSHLVEKARENAEKAGVSDRVEFREGDLFKADISEATVVTLYLLPSVNLELRPKLFRELAPGTRVVSHDFDMDEWEPDTTWDEAGETVYRWTIPEELPPFVDVED